jgi:alginate O-acetyltransferase complex protein AlgI
MAMLRMALGLGLIYVAAPRVIKHSDLLAGWLGMIGIVLMLHCGFFDVLSLVWRRMGIDAPPLMNHPLMSTSLGDFWGHRWNRAFRDVAHRFLFRPLLRPLGTGGATLASFGFSGVVHDIVISLPAGGGYGLPTLYFLLHGCGLLAERSRFGRWLGLRRGVNGRLFCAVLILGPLGLVFHPPFVREIILPMLRALGTL